MNAVACPAANQCTAVDWVGQQVTFDPTAPGNPVPTTVSPGGFLNGIACPSASQCTAVGVGGVQVTFNPTAPGNPTPVQIDTAFNHVLNAVACPSTTQCTAVDNFGFQLTFNPTAPATPATHTTLAFAESFTAIACPARRPMHRGQRQRH